MHDSHAISAALRGDARALEALVLGYQRQAHAIAGANGVPAASVDDVVQDSFLVAFRDLRRLRDPRRFGPWLLTIVRNAARRFHRAHARAGSDVPLPDLPGSEPHDALEAAELRDRLWRRVEELTPAVRETIFLYYYEGCSVCEVASALELSDGAVRKRLQEGRDALRGRLWRELEDELRDMLPSVREWRRRARALSLLAVSALPSGAAAACARSGTAQRAASGFSGSAHSIPVIAGVAVMTLKKITITGAIALVVTLGFIWVFRGSEAPSGVVAPAEKTPVRTTRTVTDLGPVRAEAFEPTPVKSPSVIDRAAAEPPRQPAVKVKVVAQDGDPVRDAILEARWELEAPRADEDRSVVYGHTERPDASAAGQFELEERHGASVLLVAAAPLHISTNRTIEVPEEGVVEPVVLELEHIGILDFRLVAPLEGDRPVAGATVGYINNNTDPGMSSPLGFPPFDFDARATVPRVHEVTSDEGGNFSIGFALGTLWITAEGYGPTAVTLLRNAREGSSERRSIPMYPSTVLAIEVARSDGAPIPGFRYSLRRLLSDLRGPFRKRVDGHRVEHHLFHECLLGRHAQVLEAVGLGVAAGDLETRRRVPLELGATNEVRVNLESAHARIAGRVLTETGAPVANARVTAVSGEERQAIYNDRIARRGSNSTRSSGGGFYELILPAETPSATLIVDETDHPLHISERILLRPGGRSEHDVVLPLPATLRVRLASRVRDRAGEKVSLTNESMDCFPMLEYRRDATFDPDGEAILERVHAGPWILMWTEDSIFRRLPVTVRAGHVHELVLGKLEDGVPRVRASGSLLSRTGAVDGVVLWLNDGGGTGLLAQEKTDSDGVFAFEDVPVGRHSLAIAFGQSLPDLPLRYVSVDVDGTPIQVDVTTSALRGRVFSAAGPLAGARVKPYTRQWIQGVERWAGFASAETDEGGKFVLEGVYQVPSIVAIEKEGHVTHRVRWRPDGTDESVLGDIVLDEAERGGGLSLRLLDADSGEPLRSGFVEVAAIEDAVTLPINTFRVNQDEGPLETGALAAGRFRVTVRAGDAGVLQYAMKILEVEHDGTPRELEVHCERGASVSLILDSDTGVLPRQATVEVRDLSGEALLAWNGQPNLVFSGSALLTGLPLEGVMVRVGAPGWKTVEFPLQPVAGRVARITKRLEREEQ